MQRTRLPALHAWAEVAIITLAACAALVALGDGQARQALPFGVGLQQVLDHLHVLVFMLHEALAACVLVFLPEMHLQYAGILWRVAPTSATFYNLLGRKRVKCSHHHPWA